MAENSLPIISARDAYDAGKKRYFTGEPCKYGHIAERYVSSGGCVECMAVTNYAKVKAWRKKNPDKRAEQDKRYAQKHPDTHQKAAQKYRAAHLDDIHERERWAQFRIRRANPEAEKARMDRWRARVQEKLQLLAGRPKPEVCDICGEFHLRIVFDHCHESGQFRGWLCDRCNKVLGLVKDSPELLLALTDYLRRKGGAFYGRIESQDTQ